MGAWVAATVGAVDTGGGIHPARANARIAKANTESRLIDVSLDLLLFIFSSRPLSFNIYLAFVRFIIAYVSGGVIRSRCRGEVKAIAA